MGQPVGFEDLLIDAHRGRLYVFTVLNGHRV